MTWVYIEYEVKIKMVYTGPMVTAKNEAGKWTFGKG